MGSMVFTGIVATVFCSTEKDEQALRTFVKDLVENFSPLQNSVAEYVIVTSNYNGYVTVAVLPSASKLGWPLERRLTGIAVAIEQFLERYKHYKTLISNGPDANG